MCDLDLVLSLRDSSSAFCTPPTCSSFFWVREGGLSKEKHSEGEERERGRAGGPVFLFSIKQKDCMGRIHTFRTSVFKHKPTSARVGTSTSSHRNERGTITLLTTITTTTTTTTTDQQYTYHTRVWSFSPTAVPFPPQLFRLAAEGARRRPNVAEGAIVVG